MFRMIKSCNKLLTTIFFLMLLDQMTTGLMINKGPNNVTECLNGRGQFLVIQMPCGFTGAPVNTTLPNWRIIRRAEDGSVISDVTRNATDINNNLGDKLYWVADLTNPDVNNSANSFLSIGPVDKSYNQLSYQCSFQLDDHTTIKSEVGTITLFDTFDPPTILMTDANTSTITVSLSSLPPSCGASRYTATISPSHGTIRMINKTFITFTGLTSSTSYGITVRVVSPTGNGRPTRVTVMTKDMQASESPPVMSTSAIVTSSSTMVMPTRAIVVSSRTTGMSSNTIVMSSSTIVMSSSSAGMSSNTIVMSSSTTGISRSTTGMSASMLRTQSMVPQTTEKCPSDSLSTEEKCPSDSLSTGAAVALSCSLTFLLSVTTTAIITFIITYVFMKNAFEGKKRGTLMQESSVQSCTNPTVIYDTVQPPSHNTEDIKLQQNPAYGTSDKVIMDNNPAYESYQH